jgi:hypothetical protein
MTVIDHTGLEIVTHIDEPGENEKDDAVSFSKGPIDWGNFRVVCAAAYRAGRASESIT